MRLVTSAAQVAAKPAYMSRIAVCTASGISAVIGVREPSRYWDSASGPPGTPVTPPGQGVAPPCCVGHDDGPCWLGYGVVEFGCPYGAEPYAACPPDPAPDPVPSPPPEYCWPPA